MTKISPTGAVIAGALGAAAILASSNAESADWEFNPRIEAGYLYDDNYRLSTPGSEVDVSGPLLDAAMEFRALSQTGEFSLTPRVRATYFPDASNLDAVDSFLDLNAEHRGERVTSRLRGEFSQLDIVSSEQPDVDTGGDLGEPDLGDSGRVLVDNERFYGSLRPSFAFDVSQRRELRFDAGYTHVSFDEQVSDAQVDYNVADLAAGLVTRLNERSNFTARLRGARYDIESRPEATNGYGAEIQWDRTTAAETRSYLRLGAQNVELVDGDSQVAWLAGAGVNFIMGRNELFLDLSRNVGPSSAGTVVSRDQLRLRWTRAFTPRLNLVAGLRGTHDEDIDDSVLSTFNERTYATGDVGLEWRWQEEFSLRVAYDYTWQEFKDAFADAKSSGALVSVTYQPLQRRR